MNNKMVIKNNKQNHRKILMLNTLATSVLLASGQLYALEVMQDDALRAVDGQDGVQISTTLSEANIDQLYWEDDAGRGSLNANGTTLRATADQVKIRQSNASSTPLGADLKINTGSKDGKVGLDLAVSASPALITVDSFRICEGATSASCTPAIGNLAIQTGSNIDLKLRTEPYRVCRRLFYLS